MNSALMVAFICCGQALAFYSASHPSAVGHVRRLSAQRLQRSTVPLRMSRKRQEEGDDGDDDEGPQVIMVDDPDEQDLPDDVRAELEAGQPSQMMVMKEMLGINIFTYGLAAAITFFFSMNIVLGPGWLGNNLGLQGTGTFDEISDSLPDSIDLSNPDYLL